MLEESIAATEKYKAKYAGTNAQNKKLCSIVNEKIEQIKALESTVGAEQPDNGTMGDRDKSVPLRFHLIMALREAPQQDCGSTT